MNERLKEFLPNPTFVDYEITPQPQYGADFYNEQRMIEYGRRIVQECAKFIEENSGYDDSNNAWHAESEDLLKHFGIEQ